MLRAASWTGDTRFRLAPASGVHPLQYGSSVRDVVDLGAVATVYATAMGPL